MDRRGFVAASVSTVIALKARTATQQLGPPTFLRGIQGAPFQVFVARPTIIKQNCMLSCWAASTAMVFAAYGHPLDQQVIINRVFGTSPMGPTCAAAPDTLTIVQALNSPYTDIYGQQFQATVVAAFDPANGMNTLNNIDIINELAANRPLLYANKDHCMVIVDVEYFATNGPPIVQQINVLDPSPWSPDYRPLSPAEMTPSSLGGLMTFVATVRI